MYLRYPNDTRGLMVAEYCRLLRSLGYSVEVVAPGDAKSSSEDEIDGVKIHRFSYFFPNKFQRLAYGPGIPTNLQKSWLARIQIPFFAAAFWLKALKVAKKSDIIHCQWLPPVIVALLIKPLVRRPIVVTVRRVESGRLMRPFSKLALNKADLVLYNSTFMKKESEKIAVPKHSMVFHNSLDATKFSPMSKSLARKKLGLPEDKKIIFYIGHLIEKKGVNYLVEALPDVFARHPDSLMLIAGYGSDEQMLKDMVAQRGLDTRVKFIGKIEADKTPVYYNAADVFVCPSIIDSKGDTETLGVVVLEAMACETPVVASEVGGIIDSMTEKTGILTRPKDPGSISQALNKLLADDRLRVMMGKAGRKRVLEKFSDQVICDNIKKAYGSLKRR